MKPIQLDVKNLQKSFGPVQALEDVSFELSGGEVLGFIGPNGAGKSTTIRILLGLIRRDGGTAQVFGLDPWMDHVAIHERISYVPGDVSLWENLSGGECIDLLMHLHGSGNDARRDELIRRFELDPTKKTKTYSKGNKQKVALVAALAVDADVYIFDEPTSGLDPLMEQVFQEEVLRLRGEGRSILLSSHILSEVERLADRIVIIRHGTIVEAGTLDELRHLTRSVVTLVAGGEVDKLRLLRGVHDFNRTGNTVKFSVDDDQLNAVISALGTYTVVKLQIAPPTLADLFIRHYRD